MQEIPKKTHYNRHNPFNPEGKALAIKLLDEGNSFRATARLVGVTHPTVIKWLHEYTKSLPSATDFDNSSVVEIDELCTFIKKK